MLEMQNRFDLREHRLERVAELADRGVERDHEHRLDDLRLGEMCQRRSKSRPSGGAFKQYRSCVDILRGELNVEPEAAITRLYLDIRRRRDEADASPEQTVPQPPDEPPGMLPAAVRRRNLTLVAGLALLLTLAAIIFGSACRTPNHHPGPVRGNRVSSQR